MSASRRMRMRGRLERRPSRSPAMKGWENLAEPPTVKVYSNHAKAKCLDTNVHGAAKNVMGSEKPIRRMTLRQLLTHSEKCARDLADLIHASFLARVSDFRDLSRPVRRRSHYPKMVAVQNALRRLLESSEQMQNLGDFLQEHLEAIRDHAN